MRLVALFALLAAAQLAPQRLDVTTLSPGAPVRVTELDLGKLKGELRRLSWSADGTALSVTTVDGDKPTDKVHVYLVTVADGRVSPVDREPDWASAYWVQKSDRYAPGLPSIEIAVEQKIENSKTGTGPAGAAEREGGGVGGLNGANDLARAVGGQERENVVRLTVFGATIAQFVNTRPLPGLTFGWGPGGSGTIAFVDPDGRLYLLDAQHKRAIPGVKDAVLPAWSLDGTRLAYLQKSGRRKYALMTIGLTSP